MRPRARVPDVDASVFVLVPADARIWHGAIGLPELASWHGGKPRPMSLRHVEIEPFVQIDADAEPFLVDPEEPPEPSAEEANHVGIAVGEVDFTVGLAALTGIERGARGKKCLIAQLTKPVHAGAVQVLDLAKLSFP